MSRSKEQLVSVAGRRLKISNLDKVLYPETGTTKAEVLEYFAQVAHVLIPQAAWRPATRKRWVDGVGPAHDPGQVFFRKDLEDSAPDWVPRQTLGHKNHVNSYPLINDPAVLAWLGQVAALEIHVPQWRFAPDGKAANPDRLVLDLDPGDGAGLAECAQTALLCRELLTGMGLEAFAVTSGSKGIHLYAPLDGSHASAEISQLAHELARSLAQDHPDLVVSDMKKSLRPGKVLVDWSQNNAAKTTICPYSLRGRSRPTVAAPRTWEEIADPQLRQLDFREVLGRVQQGLDPLAPLGWTAPDGADRLQKYRSMRDPSKTPEPVPAEPPRSGRGTAPKFVIQEHHASRLHWDFRLEHSGVLVSWAVPKGPPLEASGNRLAVMTEDHPLDYASFAGTIPKGEYGAGHVTIWDTGSYELEKWREGKEVIAVLHGLPDGGLGGVPRRYALIHAPGMGAGKNWLIHLMKDQPGHGSAAKIPDAGHTRLSTPDPTAQAAKTWAEPLWNGGQGQLPAPMLATAGSHVDPERTWSFEMKWDGIRAIAGVREGAVRYMSRNGNDLTRQYPELQELAALAGEGMVVDGEIVALNKAGRPDFGLLQSRMKLTSARDIAKAVAASEVQFMVFDILQLPGEKGNASRSLAHEPYGTRRGALMAALKGGTHIHLPPAFNGSLTQALAISRELELEGVVAKAVDSPYVPGRRSRDWIKIKEVQHQEAVVIGWRRGTGSRSSTFASLLLAVPQDGHLRYAGRVGSGFSASALTDIAAQLAKITRKTPPVADVPAEDRRDAVWVTPRLVAEVKLAGITAEGRFRHASWRGWRPDKPAALVQWEH
ncbi:ATP-dependent DNA ligase [Specibacter sp. NPDC057265]|uniref:ATP-dependent DNA ligase n=1 Tax=Specibacter sp. NPDC057265 TaxID=3346075 RepID=UPI00362C4EA5